MPAGCAGHLSFEVCFWKGCYYSQMGCVLLQTRQTLSRAPVSALLFNERLKQQGGERKISCIAWNPKCGFTPSNTHSFILSFFLVFFHFSFPFSPGRYVFIWFTNELSAVTAVFNIVNGHSHKTGRAALCWFLACGATDSFFGLLFWLQCGCWIFGHFIGTGNAFWELSMDECFWIINGCKWLFWVFSHCISSLIMFV